MELSFELRFRRECYSKVRGKFVRNEEREATLPASPPQYRKMRGTYKQMADEANRLNEIQRRSGFLDYLFFPEVAGMVSA